MIRPALPFPVPAPSVPAGWSRRALVGRARMLHRTAVRRAAELSATADYDASRAAALLSWEWYDVAKVEAEVSALMAAARGAR